MVVCLNEEKSYYCYWLELNLKFHPITPIYKLLEFFQFSFHVTLKCLNIPFLSFNFIISDSMPVTFVIIHYITYPIWWLKITFRIPLNKNLLWNWIFYSNFSQRRILSFCLQFVISSLWLKLCSNWSLLI